MIQLLRERVAPSSHAVYIVTLRVPVGDTKVDTPELKLAVCLEKQFVRGGFYAGDCALPRSLNITVVHISSAGLYPQQ